MTLNNISNDKEIIDDLYDINFQSNSQFCKIHIRLILFMIGAL
jgi:hypothetical protein